MTEENKFKKGDVVLIKKPMCTICSLYNGVGVISRLREVDGKPASHRYKVTFNSEKSCGGLNYCLFVKDELGSTTKKESDKFFLMKYRD